MNRLVLSMLVLGVALALGGPASAADGDDTEHYRKIVAEKSPNIVAIKFLMKLHMQFGVQERDQEIEREVSGVLVGSDGLVMLNNTELKPRSRRQGLTITGNPVDFKVIFPDDEDETEHEAVLAATDSNLNLAFVVIKDTKDLKLAGVDFSKTAKPEIAQELIGVARLTRGFDFAPFFGTVRVTAKVSRPRRMLLTAGTFSVPGGILYDREGTPVGVMAFQQAASGNDRGLFLLPPDIVRATIKQAGESARQVLAEEEKGDAGSGEAGVGGSDEDETDEKKDPGGNDDGKKDDSGNE